jgi:hypothetical protein
MGNRYASGAAAGGAAAVDVSVNGVVPPARAVAHRPVATAKAAAVAVAHPATVNEPRPAP